MNKIKNIDGQDLPVSLANKEDAISLTRSVAMLANVEIKNWVLKWIVMQCEMVKPSTRFYFTCQEMNGMVIPCMLYNMNSEDMQRVQLEKIECEHCKWSGVIANPCFIDLYIGSPWMQDSFDRACTLPSEPCPVCKSTLPRKALWCSNSCS